MYKIIIFLNNILLKYFFRQYLVITTLSTLSAILQLAGIGSIGLLVGLFTYNNEIIIVTEKFFSKFDIPIEHFSLYWILSFIIFLIFIASNLTGYVSSYLSQKFSLQFENILLINSVKKFFNASHLKKISSDKIYFENLWATGIQRYKHSISLFLSSITNLLMLLFYALIILYLNYVIFIVLILTGLIFYSVYHFSKKLLFNNSKKENVLNRLHARIGYHVNHAFRDIIYLNLESQQIHELQKIINKKKNLLIQNFNLVSFPRYLLEILIILIFILFANITHNHTNVGISNQLPEITVIFLSVWRSLPLINGLYRNFASFSSIKSTLDRIASNNIYIFKNVFNIEVKAKDHERFTFKDKIKFNKVKFSFDQKKYFKFNFNIKKNDWIYVFGKSGSGKTTFFNLLSGQLKPLSGDIFFDRENLNENFSKKFNIMGYIHQNIILFEGTIAENICFKKNYSKEDEKKIKEIYEICGIKQITSFKNIFKKKIFLDAPNLSGGQRQRLGLARSLYNNPEILILDESFNALDYRSEIEIFKKIKKKFPSITILYASHRKKNKYFKREIHIKPN